jgi:hypothetical protein
MSTQTFPIAGPINLVCRFGHGSLIVRAEDDLAEASVTLTARDPESDIVERTTVEMQGHSLVVHGQKNRGSVFDIPGLAGKFRLRDAMNIEVVVPSGTAMKIATFAADIAVSGRSGGADIACGATTVDVEFVDGDLRLRCGTGPIRVGRVSGSAVVKGGSGEVSIGVVGRDLDVAFGSGSLDLGVAHGSVRTRCGSGPATIGIAESDVDVTSGSGAVTIGLSPGQQARLDVMTGHGQLRTEMPVEQNRDGSGRVLTIRARTGHGDVLIRRAAQGEQAAS